MEIPNEEVKPRLLKYLSVMFDEKNIDEQKVEQLIEETRDSFDLDSLKGKTPDEKIKWLTREVVVLCAGESYVSDISVNQKKQNSDLLQQLQDKTIEIQQLKNELDERKRAIKEMSGYEDKKFFELKKEPEEYSFNLNERDRNILTTISKGICRNKDIKREFQFTDPTLAKGLKSLLGLGFIVRKEDGSYQITEKGKLALEAFLKK